MRLLANYHAHSTFCDGSETPESMVKGAVDKGFSVFGISGHACMDFDTEWTMSAEGEREFVAEMGRLKRRYADSITLLTGVERDYYAPVPQGAYDYVIGSVHYISKDGLLLLVDESEAVQREDVRRCYGGDFYLYVRDYYQTMSGLVPKTRPDIIGHFDLVTKFNEGGKLFDENDPRYLRPALEALAMIVEQHKLFEINTGAMYRLGRTAPYPSPVLLKALFEYGGEIILSSDSHDAASIGFKFNEAAELAKSCGFKYAKLLLPSGIAEYKL